MQLLGKALREHGYTDSELYNAPNASHPCCIWVSAGKDAFKWTLAHARSTLEIVWSHFAEAAWQRQIKRWTVWTWQRGRNGALPHVWW